MSEAKNINRVLVGLVVLLVVAVAVEGAILVKSKSDRTTPAGQADDTPLSLRSSTQTPGSSSPAPTTPPASPPAGSLFDDPFADPFNGSWDPFDEMQRMRERMDHLFGQSLNRFQMSPGFQGRSPSSYFSPEVDIRDEDSRYVIEMDIPGADDGDLKIDIEDRSLTVSGTVQYDKEEQGQQMLHMERHRGEFMRSLMLPGPVDASQMKAEYEDGVLTITVPKSKASPSKQRIVI